jgi:hypothetical protein
MKTAVANFVCHSKSNSRLRHPSPHTDFATCFPICNDAPISTIQSAFLDPQATCDECKSFKIDV